MKNQIYNMDCLEGLRKISDKSVDLIIVDPPYFEVMKCDWKGKKYEWDSQWNSFKEYLDWISKISIEYKRILKDNGSLYIFADDKISAYIQIEFDKNFYLENNIVWYKPNNMTIKGWKKYRCYTPVTERILFYSKEYRNNNLDNITKEQICLISPIVEYMIEQKKKIMELKGFESTNDFNEYINKITNTNSVASRHYFTYSQFVFPTKEMYEKLKSINMELPNQYEVFEKEYEEFEKEYEELRRPFFPRKNYTDLWTFNITSSQEETYHPTQKPKEMIKRIIETSSTEDSLVLDSFMGVGTTAVACKELGRNYIGFEISKEYSEIAEKRINKTEKGNKLKNYFEKNNKKEE